MRISSEWSKQIANKVITDDILEAVLFSANKRAKNCRDKAREYRADRDGRYQEKYIEKYEKQEKQYYNKKEKLLSLVTPVCIHRERIGFHRTRIYNCQKKFNEKLIEAFFSGSIVWSNSYYSRSDYDWGYDVYDDRNRVYFFDRVDFSQPEYQYYLFYVVGDHSFHTPIQEADLSSYPYPIVEIDRIQTHGEDIAELCSSQFITKVIGLIKSGDYVLQTKYNDPDVLNELREKEKEKSLCLDIEKLKSQYRQSAVGEWGEYMLRLVKEKACSMTYAGEYTKDMVQKIEEETARLKEEIQKNVLREYYNEKKKYQDALALYESKKWRPYLRKSKGLILKMAHAFCYKKAKMKPSVFEDAEDFFDFSEDKNTFEKCVKSYYDLCYVNGVPYDIHEKIRKDIYTKDIEEYWGQYYFRPMLKDLQDKTVTAKENHQREKKEKASNKEDSTSP